MNPHTSKWAPTLGIGAPVDFRMFKNRLQGSKPIGLRSSLYHWKVLGTLMSKMGLHDPFGHLTHKLLPIWLLTTKSWESPRILCLWWHVTYRWKSINEGYNLALDLISIRGLHTKLWAPKVAGVPVVGIWESRDKITFGCWSYG